MKRKLVVCALAACMVMLLATSALAAGVMPLWDKVDRCVSPAFLLWWEGMEK